MNQMRIALLGPNGQLGQDICTAAALAEQSVTIVPLDRTRIDLSQPDEMLARLRDIPFDVLVNPTGYHKTDEVETPTRRVATVPPVWRGDTTPSRAAVETQATMAPRQEGG